MKGHSSGISVAINMAMSADGKISSHRREPFQLGSSRDRQLMSVLRAQNDAIVIGSGTLRTDGYPLIVRDPALVKRRIARGEPPHPLNVIMSASLDLPLSKKLFHHPDTRRIVVTLRSAPQTRIARIERVAEVVKLPGKTVSPKRTLDLLVRRGCSRILLEGGGELNYSFLKAGLVDELYVTLAPTIIGGRTAPTVVDGRGFLRNTRLRLELLSSKRIENEVFLHYRIVQ